MLRSETVLVWRKKDVFVDSRKEQRFHIRTSLSPLDLWTDHAEVSGLMARLTGKLASGPRMGRSNYSPPPTRKGHGSGSTTTADIPSISRLGREAIWADKKFLGRCPCQVSV